MKKTFSRAAIRLALLRRKIALTPSAPRGVADLFIHSQRETMAAHPVPTPPQILSIHLDSSNGDPVLKCSGRLTYETSELFRSELKKLFSEHKNIHVDLSDLLFVDSSGLGTILSSYVSAKCAGCELKLENPSKNIRDLLKMTHLASVFESDGE
jgi:anti-sigma B factor antagonist